LLTFRSCSQDEQAPCNKKFQEQLELTSAKAANNPVFTQRHIFGKLPDEIYNDPKWAKHVQERPFVRGRGYWFWKSALFNHLVKQGIIKNGDMVVYVDADSAAFVDVDCGGCMNETEWRERLALFDEKSLDMFVERQPKGRQFVRHEGKFDVCEYTWTKQDIFEKFNTNWDDPQYGRTMQAHASFWVARVNERTRKFVQMYEELMTDFHLCSDEKSVSPDNPHFHENRHDQSMFSMLMKAQAPSMRDNGESKYCQEDATPSDPKMWKKHPTFGIENFNGHIGHFAKLPAEL